MKLRGLLAGVPLSGDGIDLEMEIFSLCWTPEDLAPGALYVELPGAALPAERAVELGAAAAVCGRETGRAGCLACTDPWQTLALLAANWFGRPGDGMTLVAVAGGEEGAAQLLKVVLERLPGAKVGLIAPDRAELGGAELPPPDRRAGGWGVQQLLRAMADGGGTHAVLLLDQQALEHRVSAGTRLSAAACNPGCGSGWRQLWDQSDMVVLNLDEPGAVEYGNTIAHPVLTYSENKDGADLVAKNLRLFPSHMEFEAVTLGRIQRIHLPVVGGFTLYHALCALACGLCVGLELEQMASALRSARGARGRLEVVPVPTAYTVVLDGARTPRELERVLVCARAFTAGQLICLFGCPEEEGPALRAQMGSVAEQLADQVILTSDDPGQEGAMDIIRDILAGMGNYRRPCCVEPDREQAIRYALGQAEAGDVIVLAGKGRRTTQRVGRTLVPLDEREIVSRYFRGKRRRRQREAAAGV